MPYPKTPRQPSPDPEGPGGIETITEAAPVGPAPVKTPQAVAGAPKLRDGMDIPRATGSGGPERWDVAARDSFGLPHVASVQPNKFDVQEVLTDHGPAVAELDRLLNKQMETLPAATLANDPFWRRFQEYRKGMAAELLTDVINLLAGPQEEPAQLSQAQQEWVESHPLGVWMNWIPRSGAEMVREGQGNG